MLTHLGRIEWFKLFLDPQVLREGRLATSARLPELPHGKQPIDVVTDFLSCLWKYAKERITEEIGSVADLGELASFRDKPIRLGSASRQR